jgi:hypothetical protein
MDARSPYHALPQGRAVATASPQTQPVEQTHFPASPTSRELVPQPPLRSEIPDVAPHQVPAPPPPVVEVQSVKAVEDPPLVAALRCFVEKRPADAVVFLDHLDRTSQEMLLSLLPFAARLSESGPQRFSPQEAAAALAQLNNIETPLRQQAPLCIKKMCFCKNIKKYGVYDALPNEPTLHPGDYVKVYAELQNFTSEWDTQHDCIHVVSNIEVRDFHQRRVWGYTFHDCQADVSQSRRQDFFNHCDFLFPDLQPGPYILWLQVIDLPTGRKAEQTLDFHVMTVRGS